MPAVAAPKPKHAIRRFDVFAEYRKQDKQAKHTPEDEAMGYGIWVAKVVASRRRSSSKDDKHHDGGSGSSRRKQLVDGKWYTLGDEPQTDVLFQHEIIDRMGRTFYRRVFAPAIRRARKDGQSYMEMRDKIREGLERSQLAVRNTDLRTVSGWDSPDCPKCALLSHCFGQGRCARLQ